MKYIITVELFICLVIMLIHYMHIFQLNSYFYDKHSRWIIKNKKNILVKSGIIFLAGILMILNFNISKILGIIILGVYIVCNIPKKKSKIPLKYTSRVKRMLVTECLLVGICIFIGGYEKFLIVKLVILNLLSPIICFAATFVNSPIEYMIRSSYISKAKKILKQCPNLIVIGVTGSYGKTSVKKFLEATLSSKYEVLVTPKNYNTTLGVVKTIRENLKSTHQIFVCEMGATKVNDIKEICDLVNPQYGIITSVGPQHLESFKTIDNVIKTKFELADSVIKNKGTLFLNYENVYIKNYKVDYDKIYTYGIEDENTDYNAKEIKSSSKGCNFKIVDKSSNEIKCNTSLIGKHNVANIAVAVAVAKFFGIEDNKIISSVKRLQSVKHRLELTSHGNMNIIDDSYNSNPVSSKSALETLGEFDGTKIVITPGLIELGKDEEKYNYELGENIAKYCDYVFLIGTHSEPIYKALIDKKFDENKIFRENSPQNAMNKIRSLNINGNVTVLIENDLPDNYS